MEVYLFYSSWKLSNPILKLALESTLESMKRQIHAKKKYGNTFILFYSNVLQSYLKIRVRIYIRTYMKRQGHVIMEIGSTFNWFSSKVLQSYLNYNVRLYIKPYEKKETCISRIWKFFYLSSLKISEFLL